MEIHRRLAVTGILFLILAACGEAGEIQGTIRVAEPYPEAKKILVTKKPHEHFPDQLSSESLLIASGGGLQNAIVSLRGEFLNQAATNHPVTLHQREYLFQPHVLIVPKESDLIVTNEDPMPHDVRIFDGPKMLYLFEMDAGSDPVRKVLPKEGTYVVRCGLHAWMHAFVVKADHPFYAISDAQGKFRFQEVPKGNYTLHIWHETLGEAELPAEITQNKPVLDVSYTFESS